MEKKQRRGRKDKKILNTPTELRNSTKTRRKPDIYVNCETGECLTKKQLERRCYTWKKDGERWDCREISPYLKEWTKVIYIKNVQKQPILF